MTDEDLRLVQQALELYCAHPLSNIHQYVEGGRVSFPLGPEPPNHDEIREKVYKHLGDEWLVALASNNTLDIQRFTQEQLELLRRSGALPRK